MSMRLEVIHSLGIFTVKLSSEWINFLLVSPFFFVIYSLDVVIVRCNCQKYYQHFWTCTATVLLIPINEIYIFLDCLDAWQSLFHLFETRVINGILIPKLFWPAVRKKLFYWQRFFLNSRLKAKNLQNFWDH